jgi:hypothetical protein
MLCFPRSYPKLRVSFLFSASSVKRRISSIISTLESSIRLQQYRLMPKLSNTSLAFSPVRILRANSSHRSPISLPQVKHLTGIIILFSFLLILPVALLFFSSCAWTAELLRLFASRITSNHGSVVFSENGAQMSALCPL